MPSQNVKIAIGVSTAVVVVAVVVIVVLFAFPKRAPEQADAVEPVVEDSSDDTEDTGETVPVDGTVVAGYSAQEQQYATSRILPDNNLCNDTCGIVSCSGFDSIEDAVSCGEEQCNANGDCKAFQIAVNSYDYTTLTIYDSQETTENSSTSQQTTVYLKN